MNYTTSQIEKAKQKYNAYMRFKKLSDYNLEDITIHEATIRMEAHNKIVAKIMNGDRALEKEVKESFLREIALYEQQQRESEEKKKSNLEKSKDILEPITSIRKMTAFNKWLNTYGNPYRSQCFSKKYTQDAVNSFLSTF